ncbi:purine-nucleoside phosphorylase [Parasediminibacterium sp. JCM 36343]|uniref:purine-nucleoside phosphorylase n=1 Tax=Parasediminibacterium sp. JCM 36343 TaxID=3374279 RepID=UPI00397CF887
MSLLMQQLKETVSFIQKEFPSDAAVGIILGSGLGNFIEEIGIEKEIPYSAIPHFPVSTVKGHGGKLIYGTLSGKKVLVMSGRFHFYEGYTPIQVTYPIRVMKLLGVHTVLLSNAAGSVNPTYKVGDLMIINDHISFFSLNPLLGHNVEELGPRFPDMTEPYSKALIAKAINIAKAHNIEVKQGVYVGVTGPTFETKAEYRLIKAVGGDVVGMSTVQENIAAVHCGMQVFAMSVVTDIGIREDENVITHEEVLEAAKGAEPKLSLLFKELVGEI